MVAPRRTSGAQLEPVADDGKSERFHVVGDDVVASVQHGPRPRRPLQGKCGARRHAEEDRRVGPGGVGEVDDVALHCGRTVDVPYLLSEGQNLLGAGDGREVVERLVDPVTLEQIDLLCGVGIAQMDAHQEPVELADRERVGAFVLDGVLGGDHHERRRELVGIAFDGDLALLHSLQQSRLRLRRRPVDLVPEHDVGKDRAGSKLEGRGCPVEHAHTGHVRGQKVGRELNAPMTTVH